MKKTYIFSAWCAFFIILTLATIFGDRGLMGELGRGFAMINLHWFGYLGYVYLLFFIYPAYGVYKDSNLGVQRIKVICGVLLTCASILVLQFCLFGKGRLGELLIKEILPFIGILGVGIATLLSLVIGLLLLMPDKIFWLTDKLNAFLLFLGRHFAVVGNGIFSLCKRGFGVIWEGISAFFASEAMREFNKPTRQQDDTAKDSTQSNLQHSTQNPFPQSQTFPHQSQLQSQSHAMQNNNPNHTFVAQNPFNQQSTSPNSQHYPTHFPKTEPEFNEKQITIIYQDNEKERLNQEINERKYAKMVRLVDSDEEGEVLAIDANSVLARAKERDKEIEIHNEPLQVPYTRLVNDTNNATQQALQESQTKNAKDENLINYQNDIIDKNTAQESIQLQPNIIDSTIHSTQSTTQNLFSPDFNQNVSQPITKEFDFLDFSVDSSVPNTINTSKATQDKSAQNLKPKPSKTFEASNALLKELDKGTLEKPKNYTLPDTSYLAVPPKNTQNPEEDKIDQKIYDLEHKLKTFKINGNVEHFYLGPVVTTFEFVPEASVKVSRIQSLSNDLALALSAHAIRIQAPIPGKGAVGIEVPNNHRETIYLREVLESELFKNTASPLALGLGKDLVGNPFVTDLKKLPHLLVAGTTGSGKSVGVNAMILSLLYRNAPQSLRLIMIDPKRVEFSLYEDIPHLLTPIITDAKKAIIALNNLTREMERRYELMKEYKTKTIDNYNAKAKQEGGEIFPFIVVIIDELADLMMTGGKDAEAPIIRIAQMGRASGLHLIVATQRPSVDVVTGLIKTNLPAKIAFKVGTRTDSRVILDNDGAQNLLGNGDMLFAPGGSGLLRLHAPWVSEQEIESIVEFICQQGEPEYDTSFLSDADEALGVASSELDDIEDFGVEETLLQKAKDIMLRDGKTSISHLQTRGLGGYPKCKKIVFQLEKDGFLSAPDSKGVRHIIGG